MTSTDPAITVTDVHRRYGTGASAFTAVRGVDLTVRRGELFALLGTNGAGAPSRLEGVRGIAAPSAGSVRVLGSDPFRDRHLVRPRTGIMQQEAGVPSDLTTVETARMWHGTLGRPMPPETALDLVGLGHRANVQVKSLSGGERRRLDLALAIMGRPEILFLDEPTTGLDPQSRRDAWELVRLLLEGGTTVVLTTHYLEEAEELADRLAIMHAGQIVRSGTVEQIVAGEPARIRYRTTSGDLADPRTLHGLPGLLGARRSRTGLVELESRDLQVTLSALLERANTAGAMLTNLEASHASLERAFLTIAQQADGDRAAPAAPVAA